MGRSDNMLSAFMSFVIVAFTLMITGAMISSMTGNVNLAIAMVDDAAADDMVTTDESAGLVELTDLRISAGLVELTDLRMRICELEMEIDAAPSIYAADIAGAKLPELQTKRDGLIARYDAKVDELNAPFANPNVTENCVWDGERNVCYYVSEIGHFVGCD